MIVDRPRLRIAIIGHARFGIGEPLAGGVESHTALLARAVQALGHRVTVFAGPATATRPVDLDVRPVVDAEPDCTGMERSDNSMAPGRWQSEDAGYRRVLASVAAPGRFDAVHNNSLHYLPVALDGDLELPMVHTLHSPPFDTLDRAHRHRRRSPTRGSVVTVSKSLGRAWGTLADSAVLNGVSLADWEFGDSPTDSCVWMGRIVPEKAPHLAIDAARLAGRPIVLAGPVQHPGYFAAEVAPRLGPDARWAGHCSQRELAALCRAATVGVVTPCWEEPFGLVIAEMLACGTPVAAFERGAVSEILEPDVGSLAIPGDVVSLAAAIDSAARLDRGRCREYAVEHLSADTMARRYVRLYRDAIGYVPS